MSRWIVMVNVPEGFVLYIYFYACVNAVPIARPIFMEPLRVKPIKMEKLRSRFAFARYARLEAAIVNEKTGRFPFCGRETSSSGAMRDETVSYDDQPPSFDLPEDRTDTSLNTMAEVPSRYHFAAHMGQLISGVEGQGCHNFYPTCPLPGSSVLNMMKKIRLR